ncbi:Protein GrpE [Alphaproteobacteria bacterium]
MFYDMYGNKKDESSGIDVPCDANNQGKQESLREECISKKGLGMPLSEESEEPCTLIAKLKNLEEENAVFRDRLLREKAENENLRKRYERELSDVNKYAISEFAKDLIDIVENLYRAKSHISIDENTDVKTKNLLEGIEMTIKLFDNTLCKYSIKRIYPEKEQFDHRYHQAISHLATNSMAENEITEVIQAGYMIADRLLRPALVVVVKNLNDLHN